MNRRTYLIAAGATAALAGCLNEDGNGTGSDGGNNGDAPENGEDTPEPNDPNGDETGDPEDEHNALAVVDEYFRAAAEENFDAMDDVMHTHHPMDFSEIDEDDDVSININPIDPSSVEREVVDEDFTTDDIRDQPNIDFWFQDGDPSLDEVLDGEEAVLVETRHEEEDDGDVVEITDRLIMLTDDGEWVVFLSYEEPIVVPDDDPVDAEEYDIVDSVEYDADTEMASVNLSDTGDVEADEIVGYSASLKQDASFWDDDSETLPELHHFSVPFDPTGDEVVVTLLLDGDEEIVIYRDEYNSENDD